MLNVDKFLAYEVSLKSVIVFNPYTHEIDQNVSDILVEQALQFMRRGRRRQSRIAYATGRLGQDLEKYDYLIAAYHSSLKRHVLETAYSHRVAITAAFTHMDFSPPLEALVVPEQDAAITSDYIFFCTCKTAI